MDRKHRNLVAALMAAVVALALFSAFSITWFHKTPAVVLPSLSPVGESAAPAGEDSLQRAEVTVSTVQQVIATLERPESYSRQVTVQLFQDGEALGTAATAVVADGGWTRTATTLPDGRVCHAIVGDGRRWVWYDQDAACQEYDAQTRSADLAQRLPTYEDVLAAEEGQLAAAGYQLSGGLPCIYAAVEEEELGYLEEYWVSVDTGLLVCAQSSREGEVFYRMSGYTVETPALPGQAFTLPSKEVLHVTGLPEAKETAAPGQ